MASLSALPDQPLEAGPHRLFGVADMGVERGEVGQLAGPGQEVEEAARRLLRLEGAVDAEAEDWVSAW